MKNIIILFFNYNAVSKNILKTVAFTTPAFQSKNNLADSQSIPKKLSEDELITEVFNVAEFLALDKEEQFAYQQDFKARLDYKM